LAGRSRRPGNPERIVERQREKEVARERLARLVSVSGRIRAHIDAAVRRFNGTPGDPASFDLLHDLLEAQAYRLACWRTATDEIDDRRFFDVNDLAGLRMEDERVFRATHGLLLDLIERGVVTSCVVPTGLCPPRMARHGCSPSPANGRARSSSPWCRVWVRPPPGRHQRCRSGTGCGARREYPCQRRSGRGRS
jgi:hypothetical protein